MSDDENVNVAEQLANTEVVQPSESENTAPERDDNASNNSESKRNDQEYNWKQASRKLRDLEKQNEELAKALNRIQKPEAEDDELDKMGDDDIMTKAQAKKMAERMARQVSERVIKEREAMTAEDRVKAKFPDFDSVVTRENIELLKQSEPEVAQSLAMNPDPYAQAVAVYRTLKTSGLGRSDLANEKQKAISNSKKPVSVNAVSKGASAIANAHIFESGLTPELKASLYKEMQECARRA